MTVPRRVTVFFALGLVAASQSGNIIRIGQASPFAIAAWRLALATALLLPLAWPHRLVLLELPRRKRALLLLAGAVLAVHFVSWIAAIQLTTVGNAASVLAVTPVLTAIAGRLLFGEQTGPLFAISLLLGTGGVLLVGAHNLQLAPDRLVGDATAVLCMVFFASYLLIGRHLRPTIPNSLYVCCVYGVAALICFAAMSLVGDAMVQYSARTWLCFALMALVPTLIGHTAINSALRYLDAGRVALATLAEPPLAALVALWAWGEPITVLGALGFVLIAGSVVLLVFEQARLRGGSPPAA